MNAVKKFGQDGETCVSKRSRRRRVKQLWNDYVCLCASCRIGVNTRERQRVNHNPQTVHAGNTCCTMWLGRSRYHIRGKCCLLLDLQEVVVKAHVCSSTGVLTREQQHINHRQLAVQLHLRLQRHCVLFRPPSWRDAFQKACGFSCNWVFL